MYNLTYKSKHNSLLILLLIMGGYFTSNTYAQTIQVAPLNHDLKVYKDLDSEMLFWPQELPVYVWLSTSDEESSPKHKLENAVVVNQEGERDIDQTSIELELSGNQYIRWVNYDTKDTLMLKFQADGIEPESNVMLAEAQTFVKENIRFFGQNLKASFNAKDEHSGVEYIYVSVNGADFSPYFSPFEFNQEKEYVISWYAVDNVGNSEAVQSTKFSVDLNAPTTRHQINGIHQGSVLSNSATISLLSEDALSGVDRIHYQFDNNTEETVSVGEISVSELREGPHSLFYKAYDRVGNLEEKNEYSFYIDRTPPETVLTIEGDLFNGSQTYVSDRTRYRLSSSDNKTGVKTIKYQISDDVVQIYNNEMFKLPSISDSYALSYWSFDNISNEETKNTRLLLLDNQSPTTIHSFTDRQFTQRGITWIPSSTKLSFTSTDDLSGTNYISYSIDNDLQNVRFTDNIEFPNEGKFNIKYWGTDLVNNVESQNSLIIVVDNTAPFIITNFSTSKIGSSAAVDGSILDEYPLGTKLFLAATDESSGTDQILYSLNTSKEQIFSAPIVFNEVGEQTITIRSVDRVGNEISKKLRLIIGE